MDMNLNDEQILEKKYLENVLSHIGIEINEYLKRRKEISDVIVDYRKKFIEEYRDDDDKIIEYFDHENYKNEKIFSIIENKVKELLYLKNSPYFGKIKIKDGNEIESFYIGNYGFDVGGETPLIIDWRAPVSSLFYQGRLGDLNYTLPSSEKIFVNLLERKQFLIKNGIIISMFDSDIDIKDEFLKEMLSLKSSSRLKNIVRTIQSKQDEIIRLNKNSTVLVNGIAGSGKTSIALHRVSYLLYNFRDYFKDKVLILCPNKIFMKYISFVLPSLGEYGGTRSFTGEDFIFSDMYEEFNFNSYETHMEKILNDSSYLEEFKLKGSSSIKNELDKFLNFIEEGVDLSRDIYFKENLIAKSSEIQKLFKEVFKSRVLNVRVNLIRKKIIDRINSLRNKLVHEILNKYESMEIHEDMVNHYDMLKRNEIYDLVSEFSEFKSSLEYLKLKTPKEIYGDFYRKFFKKELGDLDFSDLILIKYISLKIYGAPSSSNFKLVVVDEAQDFSYMFYVVLKEYTRATSYVIVGDLNQSIVDFKEDFLKSACIFSNAENISLVDSYRSTRNIIEYSKKYLKNEISINSIRDGEEVCVLHSSLKNLREVFQNKIWEFNSGEDLSIGILVRDRDSLDKLYDLIKDLCYVKVIRDEEQFYSDTGIFLTTVYFSKGIEFDYVIVVDDGVEENILYIMLTRAMHKAVHIKLNESLKS